MTQVETRHNEFHGGHRAFSSTGQGAALAPFSRPWLCEKAMVGDLESATQWHRKKKTKKTYLRNEAKLRQTRRRKNR